MRRRSAKNSQGGEPGHQRSGTTFVSARATQEDSVLQDNESNREGFTAEVKRAVWNFGEVKGGYSLTSTFYIYFQDFFFRKLLIVRCSG